MKIRIREVFLKKTLQIFATLNTLLMSWAIGVMAYSLIRNRRQDPAVQFIRREVGFDQTGLFGIIISSSFLMVTSLIGIAGAFFHCPLLFNSYRSFWVAALCLQVFCVLWSSLLDQNPIFPKYLKFFEVETLYFQTPKSTVGMWENRMLLWDEIQNQLHCCGVHDFQDWLHSACKCVPMSCCQLSKIQKCRAVLNNSFDKITVDDIRNIRSVIYPDDCMTAFRHIMNDLQTFLVVFAMIVLFVDLVFYSFCSHLLKLIEHHVKIVRREDSDFDGKFGIWLLEPSDTILGGYTSFYKDDLGSDEDKRLSQNEHERSVAGKKDLQLQEKSESPVKATSPNTGMKITSSTESDNNFGNNNRKLHKVKSAE